MNLQLFSEERTEKATPRKRQKARGKGQVFSSRELNSALLLFTSFLLIKITGKSLAANSMDFFEHILTDVINLDIFNIQSIKAFSYEVIIFIAKGLAPIALGLCTVGIIVNYMQVGFVISFEPLSPKLERINPLEGFKRIFSKRALLELVKSIVKIFGVAYIVYTVINKYRTYFSLMLDMQLADTLSLTAGIAFEIGIKASAILLIIAAVDYFYQWREYETSLMMSKQELKEEYKEVEGNPQIKSRIRQVQRQMARSRMMQDVGKADVVVTNPTHYAVALGYDASVNPAPVVLAKGADKVAEKIKQIAIEEDIPIVENKILARTLYKTVEVGDEIPESLYNAVAEVLAFIYSLKEKGFN